MFAPTSFNPRILEETPARVIPFLRAVATRAEIRAAMMAAGYTDEEQAYGWKLLLIASGHIAPSLSVTDDEKARMAIAEVDSWDESGFRRIHAALKRLHPEQDAFVFSGLQTGQGASAVVSVALLLDRLDALESSPDREATRAADHAALATLEKRGIGPAERQRLRELVSLAQTVKPPVISEGVPGEAEREAALRDLRAWYRDWSETARAVIVRRDHLILMGLAKRRRGDVEERTTDIPVEPPAPEQQPAPAENPSPNPIAAE